jgi:hypothetical protein
LMTEPITMPGMPGIVAQPSGMSSVPQQNRTPGGTERAIRQGRSLPSPRKRHFLSVLPAISGAPCMTTMNNILLIQTLVHWLGSRLRKPAKTLQRFLSAIS